MKSAALDALYKKMQREQLPPKLIPSSTTTRKFGEASAIVFTDPFSMKDKEIIDEVTHARLRAMDIKRQLDDDKDEGFSKGTVWRTRAGKARRLYLTRVDQLSEEAKRRGLVALLPEVAEKIAIESALSEIRAARENEAARLKAAREEEISKQKEDRQAAHEQAVARAQQEKSARIAAANHQNRSQSEMFVKAAYQLHSRDACYRIWSRAKQMFPHAPAWGDQTDPGQTIRKMHWFNE